MKTDNSDNSNNSVCNNDRIAILTVIVIAIVVVV